MSNVLVPELSTFELHFSTFQPQLKAVDMHSGSSGSGETGWPSPTSIAGVSGPGPMSSAMHTTPSGHEAAGMSGGLAMDPPSFSLNASSSFPASQGFYGGPSPPMTSSWAYQAPAVPETAFQPYMAPQPVEPLPMHQSHHAHGSNSRRISFGAVDEELEADARMLREVLQGPTTTDAGGLQLLFVPPVEPSREQLQHPLISSAVFPSTTQPFLAFPPLTTTPAAAKRDDFSVRPLLSSLSLSMTPSGSHSSMLKAADSSLSFSSLIKHDEHSSAGSASSSPSLQQQLAAAAAHAPALSPTVSYATGVPTLSMPSASASALPKKKRSSATRICKVEGCTKGIRSRGLCKAHGGGRRCTTPGCTTSDQGGGHCVLHGGGRRCSVEGCTKSAQWRGVCKMHGGARRCRYGNCTKNGQVKQGYCRMHHNLVTLQRQQQQQQQQPMGELLPSMRGNTV